ncbi:cytochrome P450 [Chiua virens]|nr:cytochrome P450 [Chiua virens]
MLMPQAWSTILAVAFGCIVVLNVGRRYLGKGKSHPLPPGPPGLPLIGNVIGINAAAPWLTYTEWSKKYVAKDLLEKRSQNFSDRPVLVMIELLVPPSPLTLQISMYGSRAGLGFNSVFMPYGDTWRLHRRFFHQTFRFEAIPRFFPLLHRKGCRFLQQLLDCPDKLEEHIFEYTASAILNSVYNYDPKSRKDHFVDIAARVIKVIIPALRFDVAIIIGAFPVLSKLPSWFPGISFKQKLAFARESVREYLEKPFEHALKQVENGGPSPSMIYDALRKLDEGGAEAGDTTWMKGLKEATATGFLAASETSNSVILTFFLMMIVFPAAQKKAQAQIDAVVGKGRLPRFEDRPLLPYVDALIREVLRYRPITPLSVPHASVNDDIYKGYHIPKGAIILPNVWAMSRNEAKYPDANSFIPERFLNEDGSLKPSDTDGIAFGFGRRQCVGRHFGDNSLWSIVSKVLATFNILRPVDENGLEVDVKQKFTSGIAVHPVPFAYRIEPRVPGLDLVQLEQLISASTM